MRISNHDRPLSGSFRIIGSFQQIIYGYIVKIRQFYQNLCGDINVTTFRIAVNTLAAG